MVLVGLALIVVSIDAGHIEWRLAALMLALWGAWGFLDSLFGSVIEPIGQFVNNALTSRSIPGGTAITMDEETAMLEHPIDAEPPPPPPRARLAPIPLARLHRSHPHHAP